MMDKSPKVYDGERTHSLSTRKRLFFGPNGLWQLYVFERGTETGNTNEVIDWDSAERIAWAAHDDHELIWSDHD